MDDEDIDAPESPPSCHGEVPADGATNTQPLVRWLLAFFLLLQAQFHLTDLVLNMVFRFLKSFLVLGRISTPCAAIGAKLPHTFYMAQKLYTFLRKRQGFRKDPVCKRCGTVWEYDECFEGHGVHKRLSFVNMWRNSVVVIEGQSAIVFCSRQLSWLLIEKYFIH